MTVIFPNPITIGVLGGAATLIAGSNGVINKAKKIKEKSEERKKNKEVKNLNKERDNRKWATYMKGLITNNHVPEPSVPNLYPDLKQF